MENLIACGEYPYVVDLETLFQNDIKFNIPDTAFSKATYEMFNLVTKTSLLPSKTFKIDLRQNGIDVSALDGKEQEIPHKILAPVNILTDEMRYELTNAKIPSAENIPELNGKPVSYNPYIEKIVQGFRNACNLFLKHKEELLNSNGILNEFKNVKIRIILRNTVQYSNIIQHLHHPDYMRDALLREQMLQNIWSFPYLNKEVINSEYHDLLNNDIPIFYSYTDSLDLIDSRGKIYKNYFEKSGFEKVMENISKLCEEEINKQISVIYVSTGEYESRYKKYHKHTMNLKNSNHIDTKTNINISNDFFVKEAIKIGDYILQNAIFGPETKNKSVSWLTVNVDSINKWSIGPIGGDFYDGLAGLSLFYYYLFEVTGNQNYKELFEILIYSAKQRLEEINDLSCFTGRSSLLYPLRKIIENHNKHEYKTMLQEIINDCDKNMNILRDYSWIGGTTSLIDQFLKLFQESNDPQYLNLSIKYGNYLLKQLDEANKIIGGFSHGVSSIALVLIKLGKVINNKSFITKGEELLDYDRSLFHSHEKGWIDKTEEKKQTFKYHWCHGSVGIGLSRIELSKFYDDNVLEDEIISSITSTLYNGYSSNDCLCHGNMGKTELFLSMYEKTGDLKYLNIAKNFGLEVIKMAKKNGRYQDRSIPGFPSIGIFTGIAGIGYQFLRIADVKKIPSILTLA
jgi:type 2 lantibiotic biosynthesis protein LanM